MREIGIEGVGRGQRRRTTVPEPAAPRPPDLVNRRFAAERPHQLWLADLTYIRTWSGWVYVAFALDAYSRRIVGWQIATHMRADPPLDALEMALWRQKIVLFLIIVAIMLGWSASSPRACSTCCSSASSGWPSHWSSPPSGSGTEAGPRTAERPGQPPPRAFGSPAAADRRQYSEPLRR
ncbi:DDE-type integrase/transposase/recombinase [Kitasatospora sp. NPDC001683]